MVSAEMIEEPGVARWTKRHWRLALQCGHSVSRPVVYEPHLAPGRRRLPRTAEDVMPHNARAYCDQCPSPPRRTDEPVVIKVRGGAAGAAGVVGVLRRLDPGLIVRGPMFKAAGFVEYCCESVAGLEGARP